MDEKPTGYVTVQRALQILTCFLTPNEKFSTQEISERIGFHKSAVSRLLRVMEYYGFLQRDEDNKKYSLGKTIAELGRISTQYISANLVSIAKPFADRLRDEVDEDIPFVVLSGNQIVVVYTALCSRLLRIGFSLGEIVPPHIDAGAKAILAYSDDIVRDRFIKPRATFKRFTEKTITKRSELLKVFEQVRREGVAYDFGEFHPDVIAFSAPVFNHENKAVAAITIGGPSSRISKLIGTEVVDLLKETAGRISNKLLSSNP